VGTLVVRFGREGDLRSSLVGIQIEVNMLLRRVADPPSYRPTRRVQKKRTRYSLIPLTKWEEYHPWPTERALRHYVAEAEAIGFDRVIRRVGRRILIDEREFFRWVDRMNN